jgi:hypothetical protein
MREEKVMSTSGTIFHRQASLNRKQFWIWIACLSLAKVASGLSVAFASPESSGFLNYIDTVLAVFIAMTIGARFNDIGWRRWLGIVITLVIMVVLPLALLFALISPNGARHAIPANPADALPWYVGWSSTICLIALIVVAGTRPSRTPDLPAVAG